MADTIVVKTATVTLTATAPLVIATPTHSLSMAVSGPFTTSELNEVLLESDLDASFKTYVTNYTNGAFTLPPPAGGLLMYQSIKSISGLSELVKKNGDPIVTLATEGTITCTVSVPALQPSPPPPGNTIPDSNTSYDIDFSISVAGQTLANSD